MGQIEILFGNRLRAIKNLNTAKQLGSKNPWINNHMGAIYLNQKIYKDANYHYEQTVKLGVGASSQQKNAYIDALFKQMKISYFQTDNPRLIKLAKQLTNSASSDDAWTWGKYWWIALQIRLLRLWYRE